MQQMASRKSDALCSASKIKMRHDNTRQNKCDQKHQDAEVNITSCNGISFLIPWLSNKTNTKDDTYQIRKEKPVELMRYLRLSLIFRVYLKPVFCAHPKVDMRWSHGHQTFSINYNMLEHVV